MATELSNSLPITEVMKQLKELGEHLSIFARHRICNTHMEFIFHTDSYLVVHKYRYVIYAEIWLRLFFRTRPLTLNHLRPT